MAGVAALGATFTGNAFADEDSGSAFSSADQEGGGYLSADRDGGYFGDKDGGYLDGSDVNGDDGYLGKDSSKDGVGNGSLSGLGGDMVPFNFPSRGPSMTVPVKKRNDDGGSPISPYAGFGHHDHHGAVDPYDYDLYQPTEHYDKNKCSDDGSSRAPIYASENGPAGYNGDASDDCSYDSGDYHPKRTGFQGDYNPNRAGGENGYNGYLGTKDKKLDKNDYGFGAI
jgi:hypothetical protein